MITDVPPNIPMQKIDKGRSRILLPAGIGDIYWTMVKFQSFCKKKGIVDPYVATITDKQEKFKGALGRSTEFVRMIPFVKLDDPPAVEARPRPTPVWLNQIYNDMWHGNRTFYPGFFGFDYFLVYNSVINSGKDLETVDGYECNWNFPLIVSEEQEQFKAQCQRDYGKYVVFLWSFCGGGYSDYHVKEFPISNLTNSILCFTKLTGLTPVFVGAWWDMKWENQYLNKMLASIPDAVDLVGKTNLDQLFAVIKGSEMVVGCHCGPTIMSGVFGKKTIILWARTYPHFNMQSPLVVCPPQTRNTTYQPIFTSGLTTATFVNRMLELYHGA